MASMLENTDYLCSIHKYMPWSYITMARRILKMIPDSYCQVPFSHSPIKHDSYYGIAVNETDHRSIFELTKYTDELQGNTFTNIN